MKHNRMKMITLIFTVLFLFAAVAGCGKKGPELKDGTGIILLRVNPEISVHYDEEGIVTDVVPENDDGKVVVENVRDFKGQQVRAVVKQLVAAIHDAGFFISEIDGSERDITIEIVKGSVFPEESFDKLVAKDVRSTLKEMNLDSNVLGIDLSDYDDSDYDGSTDDFITLEQAKAIALAHAKVEAADAKFDKAELEEDDDIVYYDIEFEVKGVEFEYKIDAMSGQVLKYERDDMDESDYDDDTDYDDDSDHDDDSDYNKTTKPTEDDSDFNDDSDHDDDTNYDNDSGYNDGADDDDDDSNDDDDSDNDDSNYDDDSGFDDGNDDDDSDDDDDDSDYNG
jgi:uncharacterized membrane protein YkoI